MKRLLFLAALLALLLTTLTTPQAQAQTAERCFAETGFCIRGRIRTYWEQNGGLPVFGYPITAQQIETVEGTWTGPTQWFERDRLEDHTNEGKSVLAGRLGARYLELQGRPWQPGNDGPRPGRALCTKFDVTGYNVCAPFSYYWEHNGGLERFGYPITPAVEETIEGKTYLVQYFERRRMEYHPENADPQYQILLGLLGREVRQMSGGLCQFNATKPLNDLASTNQNRMGCPAPGVRSLQVVSQYYERGEMIWVPGDQHTPPTIYAIVVTPGTGTLSWAKYIDTYVEGEAVGGSEQPPANRIAPVRGFGKVWWNNWALRDAIGWAVGGERAENADLLLYSQHDGRLLHRKTTGTVDIFFPDGEYSQAALQP